MKTAASSTVTRPRPFPTSADRPRAAPGSGRSRTKVSVDRADARDPFAGDELGEVDDVRADVAQCSRAGPVLLQSARSAVSRGRRSQSWRYCARTCRTVADPALLAPAGGPGRPPGTRRYVKPTIERTPFARARSAAATMARASATVLASGFSHSTCLPASSAAIAISAWVSPGVQMSTRSTSSRATSARQSVSTCCQSKRRATSEAASTFRPPIATRSGVSAGSKKLRALRQPCEWAVPMKA